MALANYTDLKQAIENWSHRNDISSYLDDFIDIAESEIFKSIRIRDMQKRATATLDTDRFLALPDNFIEMRSLKLINGGTTYDCTSVSPDSLELSNSSGIPLHFTVTDELVFDRTPSGTFTLEMQYWQTVTALSDSNTTNAILTRFPNIYLWGSLWALSKWSEDYQKADVYYRDMQIAIQEANQMDARGRIGPTPRMNFKGPNP